MSKVKIIVEQEGYDYERYGSGVLDVKYKTLSISYLLEEFVNNGISIKRLKLVPYSSNEFIIKLQKDCSKTLLLRDLAGILSKQPYCKAFSVQKIK